MNNGGPAFPWEEKNGDGTHYHSWQGMSLLDHYAGLAMQCIFPDAEGENWAEKTAKNSFDLAEAMIAEREKRYGK